MDRVALHVTKNFLVDSSNPGAADNPMGTTRVPLILAIWGAKVRVGWVCGGEAWEKLIVHYNLVSPRAA
jgi:hypothetical protein